MNQKTTNKTQSDSINNGQAGQNRKAARKTALILAAVALGFFAWSVYIVVGHATK